MSLRFSYDAVPAYNAFWVGPEVECGGAGGGSSGLVGGREDWLARSAGSVAGLKRQPFGRARVGKPILLLAALVQQHDLIPTVVEAHRHRVALYGGGRTGVQGPECAQRPGSPALIFQHPTDHRTAGQLKPSSCRERTSGTSTPAVRSRGWRKFFRGRSCQRTEAARVDPDGADSIRWAGSILADKGGFRPVDLGHAASGE